MLQSIYFLLQAQFLQLEATLVKKVSLDELKKANYSSSYINWLLGKMK